MEMKKPPDNSALTICTNEIHTKLYIYLVYFRINDEQKYFMVGLDLDFVSSPLILETNCF